MTSGEVRYGVYTNSEIALLMDPAAATAARDGATHAYGQFNLVHHLRFRWVGSQGTICLNGAKVWMLRAAIPELLTRPDGRMQATHLLGRTSAAGKQNRTEHDVGSVVPQGGAIDARRQVRVLSRATAKLRASSRGGPCFEMGDA